MPKSGLSSVLRNVAAASLLIGPLPLTTNAGGAAPPYMTQVATRPSSPEAVSPTLEQLGDAGPFRVLRRDDIVVTLRSKERVHADFYRADIAAPAPLVVLVHGYDNAKADHGYQGWHLASWGMHCLVVQLRSRGPWVGNGMVLMRLAQHLRANPALLDARIDPDHIVLAGHSFGATSVVVAMAGGAPAVGAVLLDPADAIRGLPGYLRKVRSPVAILGADDRLGSTRNRRTFYASLTGRASEISINEARHEDAQFSFAVDVGQADAPQRVFLGALTAAAHSLGHAGTLDPAWASFSDAARQGTVFGLRRK